MAKAKSSHRRGAHAAPGPAVAVSTAPIASMAPDRLLGQAWTAIFLAWVVVGMSTLGALFFSEVMELPPCVLCWYQRIFMFPLVLILPFGLFPFDGRVVRYALPLALVGWLISIFQLLLVTGVFPQSLTPCMQGVACNEVQIQWLGFISIPLLSFLAFSAISFLLIFAHFRTAK